MGVCDYLALEVKAKKGDTQALTEVMRVAVGACGCGRPCFVRRRAGEALQDLGIEVGGGEAPRRRVGG